jgi:hypothetical protein
MNNPQKGKKYRMIKSTSKINYIATLFESPVSPAHKRPHAMSKEGFHHHKRALSARTIRR